MSNNKKVAVTFVGATALVAVGALGETLINPKITPAVQLEAVLVAPDGHLGLRVIEKLGKGSVHFVNCNSDGSEPLLDSRPTQAEGVVELCKTIPAFVKSIQDYMPSLANALAK